MPSPCYNESMGDHSGSSNRGGPGGNPQPAFLWKTNKDNLSELLRRASQGLTELAFIEPCHYADRPDIRPKCLGAASVRYGSIALCASCDEHRSLVGEGLAGVKLPVPRSPLEVVQAAQAVFRALEAVAQHPEAAWALAHPSGAGRRRAAKKPQVRGIGLGRRQAPGIASKAGPRAGSSNRLGPRTDGVPL